MSVVVAFLLTFLLGGVLAFIAVWPVVTKTSVVLVLLLPFLMGGALTVLHIKFLPTDRPPG